MALAPIQTTESSSGNPSSVHPKETSKHGPSNLSYREKLLLKVGEEYEAAKIGYEQLDAMDKRDRVGDMSECRTGAWFAIHLHTGTVRVLSSACRLRWCPLCVQAKSRIIARNVGDWLASCKGAKFLTLTLRHSNASLDSQVTRLYACFRALRRRKYIKSSIRAGVWFFQIKWIEETESWHPHLHCVLDAEFMPHKLLKQMWLEETGDSTIVDIRAVRDPQKVAEYVARYAAAPCKLSSLNNYCKLELMTALHGRRLCGKWGDHKDMQLFAKPANTSEEYVVICHYSRLSDLAEVSVIARTLREAYRLKVPLRFPTTRANCEQLLQEMRDEARPPPPAVVPDPQLLLFDDNTQCYPARYPVPYGN